MNRKYVGMNWFPHNQENKTKHPSPNVLTLVQKELLNTQEQDKRDNFMN